MLGREGKSFNARGKERRRFGRREREKASMLGKESDPKEGEIFNVKEREFQH